VWVNHGTTPALQDILENAVLQKFAFTATGESHDIGMILSDMSRNIESWKEAISSNPSQRQLILTISIH
jgi:hypothetical protein